MFRGTLLPACALVLAAISCSPHVGQQPEPPIKHGATRSDCSGCHERDYAAAPEHAGIKPTHCATCHTETAWAPTVLTHRWPLTGPHKDIACTSCHKGADPNYAQTPSTCTSCHPQAPTHVEPPALAVQASPPQPSAAGQPAPEPARLTPPPPSAANDTAPASEPPAGLTGNTLEQTKAAAPAPKPAKTKAVRRAKRRASKVQAPAPAPPPGSTADPEPSTPPHAAKPPASDKQATTTSGTNTPSLKRSKLPRDTGPAH